MWKTKEYISDVQQKINELHKLESDFKKRAVKISISTIRAIIKILCGRISKKKKNPGKKMLSSKHNTQHIQLSDTTGTSNGTGFYGQM